MELTRIQQWYVLQAIQDRLFKLDLQIRDLEKLERTWEIEYHLCNVKEDRDELRKVRDKLQIEIELGSK